VDIGRGTFSFANFYGRRVRRLFPAFYFMCLASFVTAYFLFTPEHMARLSGALVYSLSAISNFYFYFESGYFDTNAFLKPLLHTWTLSVEEQFYLFWPMLLLLLSKSGRQWMTPLVILIAGGASLYFAEQVLITDPDAAFYLIPFRVVEFAIGGILVWCVSYQPKAKAVIELATLVGLIMIAYSVYQYTNDMVFPGFSSLLPCVGAVLVIYGGGSRLAGGLLGNFVAVRIGLISYSLYLAHWPIIVFYKYYRFEQIDTLSAVEVALILFATFLTATFMYVFIEKTFRIRAGQTKKLSVPAFGFTCVVAALILVVPAASAWGTGGWVWRYDNLGDMAKSQLAIKDRDYREYAYKKIMELDKEPFANNSHKKVLVIGDSQAGDILNMIIENRYDRNINLSSLVILAKCQPLLPSGYDFSRHISGKYKSVCKRQRENFANSEKLRQADVIILASNWRSWGVDRLTETITQINKMGIEELYVIGAKAQGESGQTLLARYGRLNGIEAYSAKRRNANVKRINSMLRKISGEFTLIDIEKYICVNDDHCRVLTPEERVIFYDKSHVTPEGARFLGEVLLSAGEFPFLSMP